MNVRSVANLELGKGGPLADFQEILSKGKVVPVLN
jgi:hypothetical protein